MKDQSHIPKQDLVDGAYYSGGCRNANVARWFAKQGRFTYYRTKFGVRYLEDIFCPEDDQVFDVFYAHLIIPTPVNVKDRIPMTEIERFKMQHPDK